MKRLNSYIIKSFTGPFFLTFLVSVFVLLMQFLWKYLDDLVGKGLETAVIIELIFYAAMHLVTMALPLAVLLASIMTFGNLGERFELLAIKASGVSLLKIMRPLIFLNILITLFAFTLADQVIPVTNAKFQALLWSVKKQRPEMIIKEGIFSNEIDGYSIKVDEKDSDSKLLKGIMIYDHTENKGNTNVIIADSGYVNMSDDKNYMILTLFEGISYNDVSTSKRKDDNNNPFRRELFKKQKIVIGVSDFNLKRTDERYFKENYQTLKNKRLAASIDTLNMKYKNREEIMSRGIYYNDILNAEIVNNYHPDSIEVEKLYPDTIAIHVDSVFNALDDGKKRMVLHSAQRLAQQNQRAILQYQTDLYNRMVWINKHMIAWHKKYSLSIACLLFFFIGAPLGAIIRKGGFGMPVVVSILLFITYYLSTIIGEKIAREGIWKVEMVVWLPTFIFFLIGMLLTHQAVTDSMLLNGETYNRLIKSLNIFRYFKRKNNTSNEDTVSDQ
ncbi:MAG: LptF/LptG family permease [Prolixibacteraceae bacterium]|jgi:lipopolysaccharide export system permease protein|nr:LptF/LptG family permease [Prolixibacteraceae bacterium]